MPDEQFTELAADRVALRRLRISDVAALVAYRSDPEVARFQAWEVPYSLSNGEQLIDGLRHRHPDTPGEWFQFGIVLRSTGELIGDCAARTLPEEPRQAEIGYTIAAEHQGRGYATEAARTLLGYHFDVLVKHRVVAICDARNVASIRVLDRLGLRREGHFRESTWSRGEWTDDLLFAMLRREWAAARPAANGPAR